MERQVIVTMSIYGIKRQKYILKSLHVAVLQNIKDCVRNKDIDNGGKVCGLYKKHN